MPVEEFGNDVDYFGWLNSHGHGYILNLRGNGEPLLHRSPVSTYTTTIRVR
jgi:hypothetical protein